MPDLRLHAYQREIRAARAQGASEEGVQDCLSRFAQNGVEPEVRELRETLAHYVPEEEERVEWESVGEAA